MDTDALRPEHPHSSLIWMTTLVQLAVGTFIAALSSHHAGPMALALTLILTIIALNISVLHLGRPAFAWRALKMWRRSWLSREVLLFALFFIALSSLTAITSFDALHPFRFEGVILLALRILTSIFGIVGVLTSARIYLVPARPAWNTIHTPFGLSLELFSPQGAQRCLFSSM